MQCCSAREEERGNGNAQPFFYADRPGVHERWEKVSRAGIEQEGGVAGGYGGEGEENER